MIFLYLFWFGNTAWPTKTPEYILCTVFLATSLKGYLEFFLKIRTIPSEKDINWKRKELGVCKKGLRGLEKCLSSY